MKRIVSLVIVLVLMLSLGTAAMAEDAHVHEFGEWQVFRSPTETREGIDRRWCKCGAMEERKVQELPNIYISNARDNELHRSVAVTGVVVGKSELLSNWISGQMADQLELLTDRHFNQIICVKYEGLGVGSFVDQAEHTVGLTADQLDELMAARDGLCLQLTTARASVLIENADLESLKPSESIKLHTKLDGGKLLVELLVDDKAVNVPMRVLTWSKGDKEYVGNADSELGWGIDEGVKYITAFSSLNGSGELEVSDLSAKPEGWGWLRYKNLWKLRLGDKFQY